MIPDRQQGSVALPERGAEFAFVDWGGDGPLCLFTHANGFCADTFGLVAQKLRTRYHVVGYDSRGHGDSSQLRVPDDYEWEEFTRDVIAVTEALLERFSARRVALGVGHSFGGTCLVSAAARRPDLFEQLALLDPVLLPPPEVVSWKPGEHPMAEQARKRTHVFESRDALRAKWRERGTFGDWDPRALELYLQHGFRDLPDGRIELKCPGEVEAAVYELGRNFDLRQQIRDLKTPTTLYFAEHGNFPRAYVDELPRIAPAIRVDPLPAGHLLPMIVPDLVAQKLLAL